MRALHLYFRLHRPYVLKPLDEVEADYFGGEADFREANRTEYQPLFALIERNAQKFDKLKVSFSVSGLWLEQAEKWDTELIRRLRKLVNLGRVQLLAEPYDYSLASFYDAEEFEAQVDLHRRKMEQVFGVKCDGLAMPELIYHDKLAKWAEKAGYKVVLAGAAERILDFRNTNQVFVAADCKELRVICQNSKFSRAIRQAEDLVLIEVADDKADVAMAENADEPVNPTLARQHKTTAAEFVRGMSSETKSTVLRVALERRKTTGRMMFSAKKCQKELELESLRGNLINICLDPAIFREYQSMGIVRFFDELIAGWLNNVQNKFLNASEMAEAMVPTGDITVKTTINWRGELHADELNGRTDIARLDDVRYCPPDWLRGAAQIKLTKKLYSLKDGILRTKDKDLYQCFQRLTALDYLVDLNAKVPVLVGQRRETVDPIALKQAQERFSKVLDDFSKRILDKLPQPPKITAKASDEKTKAKVEPEEDPFAVKVKRVISEKPKVQTNPTGGTQCSEGKNNETGDMDWDDVIWDEERLYNALDDAEETLDYVETGVGDPTEEGFEFDPDMDEIDFQVQMLEQKLMRKKSVAERELKDLIEAEVVTDKKLSKAKHRIKKKIVFE